MVTKIYDLSQPFGVDTPLWPFPGPRQDLIFQRAEYLERAHKRSVVYTGTLHAGTHMDAPSHVLHPSEGGVMLDQVPLENCYGTGVVVDFRHMKDMKWHIITPEDLEKATPEIEAGDFVVFNTGWHKLWRFNNYEYFNHYASLGPEAAEWLVKKKVKAVAGTWGATDSPLWHYPLSETMPWLNREYRRETGKDPDVEFPEYEPCHRILMRNGIVTYENAGGDIDLVTGKRCTLAGFPFRCELADGGMVRLVAIIEE
jgi:kynurenine formamidase